MLDYVPVKREPAVLVLSLMVRDRALLAEAGLGLRGWRLGGGRVLLRLCRFDIRDP